MRRSIRHICGTQFGPLEQQVNEASRQRTSPGSGSSATNGLKSTRNLERARGFEPPTPTLARLCSTPELHPHQPAGSLPRL